MDSSVIVLDSGSSDEEAAESDPLSKEAPNKTTKAPNTVDSCVVGKRVLLSNQHITITKTRGKPVNSTTIPSTKINDPNQKSNNATFSSTILANAKTKPQSLLQLGKRKTNTDINDCGPLPKKIPSEITIMPIGMSSVPKGVQNKSIAMNAAINTKINASTTVTPTQKPPTAIVKTNQVISCTTVKRITPVKISSAITIRANSLDKSSDSDVLSRDSMATNDDVIICEPPNGGSTNGTTNDQAEPKQTQREEKKTPLNEAFTSLIEECRKADSSDDMERMINRKLIKYYQSVHPNFVNSKSFCKNVTDVVNEVKKQPGLVYLKISGLLEELNTRRKSAQTAAADDAEVLATTSTGDEKKDRQIKKLNKALYLLKKKITQLEEEEVDWDDEDNSQFMIAERYKKRAWQIYEKICDITGESKNAQRLVKRPIKFRGTSYPEFNRKLEKFVNEMQSFPDMFDVMNCLEHCNKEYRYRLNKEDCKRVAQDAFLQIGSQLQKRRKTDLYEMVTYFTKSQADPALEDADLKRKLELNQKSNTKKMNEILQKFTINQDPETSEEVTNNNHPNDKTDPSLLESFEAIGSSQSLVDSPPPPRSMAENAESLLEPLKTKPINHSSDISLIEDALFDENDLFGDIQKNDQATISENEQLPRDANLENEFGKFEDFDVPSIASVTSLYPNLLMGGNEIILSDEEIL